MNLFAWSGLLAGIACTIMAGLVYFTNRQGRVNRVWALFCLAASIWGFLGCLIGVTTEPAAALMLWRVAHIGVILMPVLFYHFTLALVRRRKPTALALMYAMAALLLAANMTPLLVAHVRLVFGQFYYDSPPGPLYGALLVFFLGLIGVSHVELWKAQRQATNAQQRRLIQWLLVGSVVGYAGGSTCFLPVYGVDVYPYGNFAVPLFPLIMTYAFLRYRLMDVNAALVRGVTFLVLYAVVALLPFVIGVRYAPLWHATLGRWWWVAPMVVMGVVASASPVLFLVVVRRLEQRVWKAQRRYHRTLIAASNGMTRIKELSKLCRLIVYVVNRTVGLSNAALLLYQSKQERYELMAVRYKHTLPAELAVRQAEPLIALLKQEKELLLLDELTDLLSTGRAEAGQRVMLEAAVAWMRRHEVRLIVPSFSQEELLAFLALGPKRRSEAYTTDDIAMFSALANQATLAIENALFFEELKNNEAYMVQSEKLASLGQLASGMAHEIHNPLTIISGEAQLYLERFKSQNQKVDELLHSIIEECHRAADITRRILRFAKPSPQEFGEVNLGTTLQETLTLAGYQVHLEKVERNVEVPPDLPPVRGNQNQLQEVFLNLVLNACQAMGASGGSLELTAKRVEGQAELTFADTGPGIPAGKLSKIFDPFYTTKATGTGLGLFVSQRIIRAHGGTIEVQSTEGQGTTFTIRLPFSTPSGNGLSAVPGTAQAGKQA